MAGLIDTVKNEIIEVVGCTEPSAIAYAFAQLAQYHKTPITPENVKATLYLSHDVYRNASTAGIPYLNEKGILPAAAMGVFSKNAQLNVFARSDRKQLESAKRLLKKKEFLKIIHLKERKGLFIKAQLSINGTVSEIVIEQRHDFVKEIKINGKKIFSAKITKVYKIKGLGEIVKIVNSGNKDLEKIAKDVILANGKAAAKLGYKYISNTLYHMTKQRMNGKAVKIITITGSGNHGIFLSVPFYYLYKEHGEKVLPAFVFALLTLIYFTQRRGRLTNVCGLAAKAAPALLAGLLYFKGKTIDEIEKQMKLLDRSTRGLVCKGAEETCGYKSFLCFENVKKITGEY
ncbi:MAG: L-serine ammonia-lyase, iron-sulfur-dependent, subunit alpha [Candidatus Omnitrophica bacterium]|nr:L-serine ammonia-lyase, iron-sulfur-dependent, subunit alpha [Candidatus Omnitrophota bacterium]